MKQDQASDTALLVQQALLYSATRCSTAHLVSADSRDASIRLMSRLPQGQRVLGELEATSRWRVALKERLLVPGIAVHHALRKRWVEDQVRSAIDTGARQLVLLGAGFDTLPLRLAGERSDLVLIEVDHPATQRAKRTALEGEDAGGAVAFLPVDFTKQTLAERLPQADGFDPTLGTVVVCEGVLPYLDESETRVLFRSIRELCGAGTRVVFTFLARRSPTGRQPYGPLLRVYLALASETMRMRVEPDELRAMLSPEGVVIERLVHSADLIEQYGAPSYRGAIHDLEMMASATVGT